MDIDKDLLNRFEETLIPHNLSASPISATILGFGEISSIFQIEGHKDIAFKRMPLFPDRHTADKYVNNYQEYCALLQKAGINLPEDETVIVEVPHRPVVLYIAQKMLPKNRFCHQLINTLDLSSTEQMIERIVESVNNIWDFNRNQAPKIRIAIDGQLSNWVWLKHDPGNLLYYIDTGTPLFQKNGVEQLDPELLLKSAPGFLRWIIRMLFLKDVMTRYYNPALVFSDLAANLHKEQRPDLIPLSIRIINRYLPEDEKPLSMEGVTRYYQEDKLIWMMFLSFRRLDRFLSTKMLGRRYEFILPGKIAR
jgi:hypothetical protein